MADAISIARIRPSRSTALGVALLVALLAPTACAPGSAKSASSDLDASCLDDGDAGQRVFFFLADAGSARDVPECPPSCHPRPSNAGTFPVSDQSLPGGPCSAEGEQCAAEAAGWCPPCIADHGPGNGYLCTCTHGAWSCGISSQGAASCPSPSCLGDADAGVHATGCPPCAPGEGCVAGACRPLCDADSDCDGGTCHSGETCFPVAACTGPAPCPAVCRGYCR